MLYWKIFLIAWAICYIGSLMWILWYIDPDRDQKL
jgi:hypothetical protein